MTTANASSLVKAKPGGYKMDSPFLNLAEFTAQEQNEAWETSETELEHQHQHEFQIESEAVNFESPFLTRGYAGESSLSEQPSPSSLPHALQFLSELHDQRFNEALFELYTEAEQYHDEQGIRPSGQFEQLAYEAEQLIDRMNQGIGARNLMSMQEAELEELLQQYEPETSHLSPQFEHFIGRVFNKVKSIAKGAVDLAKKGISLLPINQILNKLKALIRPLLKQVLRAAINRLPAQLQAPARTLASRFLREAEAEAFISELEMEEEEEAEAEAETVPDIGRLQHEFDSRIAQLVFSSGEFESEFEDEMEWGELENEFHHEDALERLHEARETFIRQIGELRDGENPGPALEQFIPAILPMLKVGISIIGRPKVVKFLAGLLGQLIEPVVGRQFTPMLSKAIVDIGMRMISLESPLSEAQAGASAVAAAVEDTVREAALLPEAVLENEELLQSYIQSAFEAASAANFPSSLLRPELRETSGLNGTWVMMPVRGNKKYYKKFTRTIEITITPQMAKSIRTFRKLPLYDFLRDHKGVTPGKTVKARVHLYESILGTTLSRIARSERHVPGLGGSEKAAWSQIHPLTPETAGILFREPGLGRKVSSRFLATRRKIAAGKRFFYLEIAGTHVQVMPKPGGPRPRKSNQANVTLDFPRKQIRTFLFVSEADSQQIAAKLRQGAPATSAVMILKSFLHGTIRSAFSGQWKQHVKIIQEYEAQEQFIGGIAKKAGVFVLQKLGEKLLEWLEKYLTEYFKQKAAEFITATAKDADGVTIMVTFTNPPGLGLIQAALKGDPKSLLGGLPNGIPDCSIQVYAGFRFK